MKRIESGINFVEFRAKKHWWIWAIGILCHFIIVRICFPGNGPNQDFIKKNMDMTAGMGGILFFAIIIIIDMVILPDASHFKYVINDKFLEIKCVLFPGADILLASIISVQNATLMTFPGFGIKVYEESFGAYKINYVDGRREKSIIIAPKNRIEFIKELSSRIDKNVILLDNIESAFKKKKDNL